MIWFAFLVSQTFTPGALCTNHDPDFLAYRYKEQVPICRRHVTISMKIHIAAAYGIARADWPKYEFDHRIPLALGGSNAYANVWPELWPHALDKDVLEASLYWDLARGRITQKDAVAKILEVR